MTDDGRRTRRSVLRAGLALCATAGLAGCLGGPSASRQPTEGAATTGSDTTTDTPGRVGTEFVAAGFSNPLGVEFQPGDSTTAHVVDQTGVVYAAGPNGVREEPFLDVRDRVVALSGYEERGLLGLAFHPDFANDGRVFVRYSAPATGDVPDGYSHTFVLSSFRVTEGSTDPDSETRLLALPQPQPNHNAGSVAFGPDGYLYVGTGDGGGANDTGQGHAGDWYADNDGGNGQDVTGNLLGSVLRIDVDAGGDQPYAVPEDNPLVGREGLDEQYAWGFRNPWRFSFAAGDLFVADVGQNRFEEVSLVEAGGNYGWNVREGTHCFSPETPGTPPDECPRETGDDGQPLVDPIVEYAHGGEVLSGVSVIGGYRYRGSALPGLSGAYVFGDWQADGRLFLARPPGDDGNDEDAAGLWDASTVDLRGGENGPAQYLLAFGRDADDELYVATTGSGAPTGSSGAVHRLVGAE